MASDDEFAEWATLFSNRFGESKPNPGLAGPLPPSTSGIQYSGVTPAAGELLRAVDAGGIPAFVTNNLKQIAEDNGIVVGNRWTPNEIVEAIRGKASIDSSGCPVPPA